MMSSRTFPTMKSKKKSTTSARSFRRFGAMTSLTRDTKIQELEKKIALLSDEAVHWQRKTQEALVDLRNVQNHHDLESQQIVKKTKKSVIQNVFAFCNNLLLAFQHLPAEQDPALQSFVQTLRTSFDQLIAELQKQDVEIVVPQEGDEVDVSYMSVLNATGSEEDPVVARVISAGLKIEGQLVQPASVMV
jgi:molecular chaperone GrpE (heat shock protein)